MGTPAQALKHRGDNKLYRLQVSVLNGRVLRRSGKLRETWHESTKLDTKLHQSRPQSPCAFEVSGIMVYHI